MAAFNKKEHYTLITGASGGIGREIAELLAKRGNNLVLVARRKSALLDISSNFEKLYQIKVLTMACDLSVKDTPKAIYEWCKNKDIVIDTIVNNAGRGLFGQFSSLDIKEQMNMIELNISGLVQHYSVYGATKAFVLSYTEALRQELSTSNINVSCLCPGDTNTEFLKMLGILVKRNRPRHQDL